MASPTVESLCCMSSKSLYQNFLQEFHSVSYNVVCVISSCLGIFGAIYQIFVRGKPVEQPHDNRRLKTRGKLIISWLAMADLMAATGILIRSASWLTDKSLGSVDSIDPAGQTFCILTSVWIHYFYTATYVWTFLYALDVRFVLLNKDIRVGIYHFLGWSLPVVLCLFGLLFLYLPDLDCHSNLINPYRRILPNYLSTFVPIVLVMTINPILYFASFSSVEYLLITTRGRFTQAERRIVQGLKYKFYLINIVFYICWVPNVLNGIIMWSTWKSLPEIVISIIWYLMAILNPLQAVMNCFVYRSWSNEDSSEGSSLTQHSLAKYRSDPHIPSISESSSEDCILDYSLHNLQSNPGQLYETTPLLSAPIGWNIQNLPLKNS